MQGNVKILPTRIVAMDLTGGGYPEQLGSEIVNGVEQWVGKKPTRVQRAVLRAAASRLTALAKEPPRKKRARKAPAKKPAAKKAKAPAA